MGMTCFVGWTWATPSAAPVPCHLPPFMHVDRFGKNDWDTGTGPLLQAGFSFCTTTAHLYLYETSVPHHQTCGRPVGLQDSMSTRTCIQLAFLFSSFPSNSYPTVLYSFLPAPFRKTYPAAGMARQGRHGGVYTTGVLPAAYLPAYSHLPCLCVLLCKGFATTALKTSLPAILVPTQPS